MFIMCFILVDNLNIFTLYLKDNNNYDNKKKIIRGEKRRGRGKEKREMID